MSNECEDVRELLSALVDGELDAAQRKVVSAHLITCDECSREVGRLVGARGLTQREAVAATVPAGFLERLRQRLDAVDGVVSRRRPARRLIGIAAVGAIAISIAIIFSTVFFMNADRAGELAAIHMQVTGPAAVAAGRPAGFTPVSCAPEGDEWSMLRRSLVRVEGTLVGYALYTVGDCPVSIFEGPDSWHPYREGWMVTERIGRWEVRQVGDQCMTSYTHRGQTVVIVATTTPQMMARLADTWRWRPGRSIGL